MDSVLFMKRTGFSVRRNGLFFCLCGVDGCNFRLAHFHGNARYIVCLRSKTGVEPTSPALILLYYLFNEATQTASHCNRLSC